MAVFRAVSAAGRSRARPSAPGWHADDAQGAAGPVPGRDAACGEEERPGLLLKGVIMRSAFGQAQTLSWPMPGKSGIAPGAMSPRLSQASGVAQGFGQQPLQAFSPCRRPGHWPPPFGQGREDQAETAAVARQTQQFAALQLGRRTVRRSARRSGIRQHVRRHGRLDVGAQIRDPPFRRRAGRAGHTTGSRKARQNSASAAGKPRTSGPHQRQHSRVRGTASPPAFFPQGAQFAGPGRQIPALFAHGGTKGNRVGTGRSDHPREPRRRRIRARAVVLDQAVRLERV